jgi:hypothetical protein
LPSWTRNNEGETDTPQQGDNGESDDEVSVVVGTPPKTLQKQDGKIAKFFLCIGPVGVVQNEEEGQIPVVAVHSATKESVGRSRRLPDPYTIDMVDDMGELFSGSKILDNMCTSISDASIEGRFDYNKNSFSLYVSSNDAVELAKFSNLCRGIKISDENIATYFRHSFSKPENVFVVSNLLMKPKDKAKGGSGIANADKVKTVVNLLALLSHDKMFENGTLRDEFLGAFKDYNFKGSNKQKATAAKQLVLMHMDAALSHFKSTVQNPLYNIKDNDIKNYVLKRVSLTKSDRLPENCSIHKGRRDSRISIGSSSSSSGNTSRDIIFMDDDDNFFSEIEND